jgi:hypothetical protein
MIINELSYLNNAIVVNILQNVILPIFSAFSLSMLLVSSINSLFDLRLNIVISAKPGVVLTNVTFQIQRFITSIIKL